MELKLVNKYIIIYCKKLLIVPYGIETCLPFTMYSERLLLIVPYGIETTLSSFPDNDTPAFNRTLWN